MDETEQTPPAPPTKRPVSVLVVVFTAAGEFLLMKRIQPAGFWQSVTGSLRAGEAARDCAVRELAEETGFEAKGLRDLHLTQRFPIAPEWRHRYAPDVNENVEHAFALRVPRPRSPHLNPTEHRNHRWLPGADAMEAASSWTDRTAMRRALSEPAPRSD
jgi:dATP pyrophosphohydrolase